METLRDIVALIAGIAIWCIVARYLAYISISFAFGFMLPPYLSMFVHYSLFGQTTYDEVKCFRRMDKIDIVCFAIGICISIFVCYKWYRSENPTKEETDAAIAEYKAAELQRLKKEQEQNRKRQKEEEERLENYKNEYIKHYVKRDCKYPVSAPSPIVEKVVEKVVERVVVKESPSYFILKCPNCMAIINNDNLCCEHCATKVRKAA